MNKYKCELNLNDVIDWQRSNAEKLKAIIQKKQDWYQKNHCDFWNDWVVDVFDLETANDFGLSVWSIILDEALYGVSKKSDDDFPAFGFGEFNHNFFGGAFALDEDSEFNFTTEQKRIILKLKAYIIHSNGSTKSTNEALKNIFGKDQLICLDTLKMSLSYVIKNESLIPLVKEIRKRDLLPRPAGVGIKSVIDANVRTFGFGDEYCNFNDSNFYNGEIKE